MILETFFSMLIGYAFGCIQAAYFVGRTFGKMDIREHGSGNAGTSNVTTTLGLRYGVIVGAVDILKGALAVLVVQVIYPDQPALAYLSGLMAIVGHMFPFFMGFRGGKGVATLIGMMAGLNIWLGVLFSLLVIVPGLLTDYIVSGSFTTFAALPVVTWLRDMPPALLVFSLALLGVTFYLHRGNIRRIRAKEETRVSEVLFKKKPAAEG